MFGRYKQIQVFSEAFPVTRFALYRTKATAFVADLCHFMCWQSGEKELNSLSVLRVYISVHDKFQVLKLGKYSIMAGAFMMSSRHLEL